MRPDPPAHTDTPPELDGPRPPGGPGGVPPAGGSEGGALRSAHEVGKLARVHGERSVPRRSIAARVPRTYMRRGGTDPQPYSPKSPIDIAPPHAPRVGARLLARRPKRSNWLPSRNRSNLLRPRRRHRWTRSPPRRKQSPSPALHIYPTTASSHRAIAPNALGTPSQPPAPHPHRRGSRADFVNVNRATLPLQHMTFLAFAINPQVHTFDDASTSRPSAPRRSLENAKRIARQAVSVGPITLRRQRHNPPPPAGPEPSPAPPRNPHKFCADMDAPQQHSGPSGAARPHLLLYHRPRA